MVRPRTVSLRCLETAFIVATGFLGLFAGAPNSFGETWSARCGEMEFVFDRGEKQAKMALVTEQGRFPIAEGTIRFDNDVALRAWLPAIGREGKAPRMEVGLNRVQNVVYLLRRDAAAGEKSGAQQVDSELCKTPIRVEP